VAAATVLFAIAASAFASVIGIPAGIAAAAAGAVIMGVVAGYLGTGAGWTSPYLSAMLEGQNWDNVKTEMVDKWSSKLTTCFPNAYASGLYSYLNDSTTKAPIGLKRVTVQGLSESGSVSKYTSPSGEISISKCRVTDTKPKGSTP
jgi:hypothetical protein